jgi:predicted DNA-binding transcriptional regulator AlpA
MVIEGYLMYFTASQVSERLQISVHTLKKWRSENKGPRYVKIERLVRYRYEDVLDWINSRVTEGTSK